MYWLFKIEQAYIAGNKELVKNLAAFVVRFHKIPDTFTLRWYQTEE